MSISLDYLLKRKKSTLKHFIEKNKLTSYDGLVEYCKSRNLLPCNKDEYDNIVIPKEEKKKSINVKKEVKETTKNKKPVSGKVSKAPRKRKGRNTSKKE